MDTYLLTWNPLLWAWDELDDEVRQSRKHGYFDGQWNFGTNFRQVSVGSRVFVIRQKVEPKGIIASGNVTSEPWEDVHYADKKKTAWYVNVRFDVVLPVKDMLPIDSLCVGKLSSGPWGARASGASILSPVCDALETKWKSHLGSIGRRVRTKEKRG